MGDPGICVLVLFSSAPNQDNERIAIFPEIDSITGPEINSAFKDASAKTIFADNDVAALNEEMEFELIKQIIKLPEIIEDIANDYQVQRLPQYALELVRKFHQFYENCRVISPDQKMTQARLSLVEGTKIVLKSVLDLMGISAPEKM